MRIYFTESGMNLNWLRFVRDTSKDPVDPTPTPTPNPSKPSQDQNNNSNTNQGSTQNNTQNNTQDNTLPAKGTILQDAAGILKYRVTKADAKNGTVEVAGVLKKKAGVTIPSTVTIGGITYKVTGIAEKAFQNNKTIKSVVIGANVKKIGKQAFEKCKKLQNITLKGKKAPTIGKAAFKGIKKKAKVQVADGMKKSQIKKLQKRMKAAAPSVKITYQKKVLKNI